MRNLLKNKIFVLLLMFVLLTISFYNSSFAYSSVDEVIENDLNNTIQKGYSYISNLGIDTSIFDRYLFITDCVYFFTTESEPIKVGGNLYVNYCIRLKFNSDFTDFIEHANDLDNSLGNDNGYEGYWDSAYFSDIKYSSFDIGSFTKNVDFFHPAPQGITGTLVEETAKVQIMEQLKTMIVGFLKYLIALVVSVVAFWKGWQLLSTQLKKA